MAFNIQVTLGDFFERAARAINKPTHSLEDGHVSVETGWAASYSGLKDSISVFLWACYGLATGTTLDGAGIDRRLKKDWDKAQLHKARSLPQNSQSTILPSDIQDFLVSAAGMPVREMWGIDAELRASAEMEDDWRRLMKNGMSRYDAQQNVIRAIIK